MMEIYLVKARNLLHVLFNNAEFTKKPFEGALFRRHFEVPQGLKFTFEKTGKGFFLYIKFDRYMDPAVLSQIANGQSVGELEVLWKLAHLPRAKIFGSKVLLPDGRSVELIDTVRFELRKVWEGAWESEKNETEVYRRLRRMRLNRLRDEVPGIFSAMSLGADLMAGKELLLRDAFTESEPGTQSSGSFPMVDESTSKQVLDPKVQPAEQPQQGEPQMKLNKEFKKPTAKDINDAIQLLLWRCRDAEIYKDTPNGKKGFYGLDDWIATANDLMIRELGLWCADIQELNIGTRDS